MKKIITERLNVLNKRLDKLVVLHEEIHEAWKNGLDLKDRVDYYRGEDHARLLRIANVVCATYNEKECCEAYLEKVKPAQRLKNESETLSH
jgi:hypothetical protein